eukprot:5896786-Pleurochrysis_carterae.AAC.1
MALSVCARRARRRLWGAAPHHSAGERLCRRCFQRRRRRRGPAGCRCRQTEHRREQELRRRAPSIPRRRA